jgi:hypothetical protein
MISIWSSQLNVRVIVFGSLLVLCKKFLDKSKHPVIEQDLINNNRFIFLYI